MKTVFTEENMIKALNKVTKPIAMKPERFLVPKLFYYNKAQEAIKRWEKNKQVKEVG